MVADEALAEVQVKVALPPAITVAGKAAILTVGAATGVGTKPTHPVSQAVRKLTATDNNRRWFRGRGLFMSVYGCQKGRRELLWTSIFCEFRQFSSGLISGRASARTSASKSTVWTNQYGKAARTFLEIVGYRMLLGRRTVSGSGSARGIGPNPHEDMNLRVFRRALFPCDFPNNSHRIGATEPPITSRGRSLEGLVHEVVFPLCS